MFITVSRECDNVKIKMSKGELYVYGKVVRDIRRFIHPRRSILASGNMVFLGSINLHISLTTMPLIIIVYNTKTMQAQIQLKGKHMSYIQRYHIMTLFKLFSRVF